MKIRVQVDRQCGPIIGSRLDFDYVIPEPTLEELRRPAVPSVGEYPTYESYREASQKYEHCLDKRSAFITELAGILARSIRKGLDQALDSTDPAV